MIIPDPYRILQLEPSADDHAIEVAYRRLAKMYHPDIAGAAGVERMVQVNLARDALRNPAMRAAVDRARQRRAAAMASVAAADGRDRVADGMARQARADARPETPTPVMSQATRPGSRTGETLFPAGRPPGSRCEPAGAHGTQGDGSASLPHLIDRAGVRPEAVGGR